MWEIMPMWDTHIVALLPPSSSPPDSTTTHTHSLSLQSFSLCNPSLHSQLQTECSFPSRHLNMSIHSTSHAYQICQLTNGRAGRPREVCIKMATFPAWDSQRLHQEEATSRKDSSRQKLRRPTARPRSLVDRAHHRSPGILRQHSTQSQPPQLHRGPPAN